MAGNVGLDTATATIDYTAPVMSDDAPDGWQSNDVTVTVDMADPLSGLGYIHIKYENPPSASELWYWPMPPLPTYSNSVQVSWEGTTTLTYDSYDAAGNVAATQTAEILIDKSDPTSRSDRDVWSSMPVTVTIEASDTVSGYRRDPLLGRRRGSEHLPGTVPGLCRGHALRSTPRPTTWQATSASDPAEVKLDYTAPTMTTMRRLAGRPRTLGDRHQMDAPRRNGPWRSDYDNPPDFCVTSSYVGQRPSLRTTRWTHPVTWEGTTTLDVLLTDWVGNVAATRDRHILIDKTPPSTTPTYPAGWQTMDISSHFGDRQRIRCRHDLLSCRRRHDLCLLGTVHDLKDGTTTVDYWSVDLAGNVETSDTAMVQIDHDAPMTSDDCPTDWQAAPFSVTTTRPTDLRCRRISTRP